jgi:phosphotransferase system  glucose/maltose/N-acetylglucosamine-specific IIC component
MPLFLDQSFNIQYYKIFNLEFVKILPKILTYSKQSVYQIVYKILKGVTLTYNMNKSGENNNQDESKSSVDIAEEAPKSDEGSNYEENKSSENQNEEETKKKCNWKAWIIRLIIVLLIAGFAIWAIIDSDRLTDWFESFIDWIRDNPILGPFILIIVYIIATVLFLPGIILTLGAGFALNEAYGNPGGKHSIFHQFSCHCCWVCMCLDWSRNWKHTCYAYWSIHFKKLGC